ncbi:Cna B-type domain-containing protein, partial [Vagococcus penaei]
EEVNVPTGYTSSVDGMTVTNTYTPETTTVKAVKKWEDKNDQDGKRPNEVTINVKDGSEVVDTLTVLAPQWEATSKELPKNKNGQAITYTLEEVNVPTGYTSSVDGMTVTNTYTPETTTVKAVKKWEDKNDQDGKRPNEVTINVKDGSEVVDTLTVTGPSWEATSKKLPKNKNGKAITYTLEEVAVPTGYTSSVDGMTVTNTYVPETTSLTVTKKWEDQQEKFPTRPTTIQAELIATVSKEEIKTEKITLSEANRWSHEFSNLPVYYNKEKISYSVKEINVPAGYESKVTGTTITNTLKTKEIPVTKVWDDHMNQDGTRPKEVIFHLLADGKAIDSITLTGSDDVEKWTGTFKNVPMKNQAGEDISYTIAEEAVAGYTIATGGIDNQSFTITNVDAPDKTSVTVTKVWDDAANQDGKRPENITVTLVKGNQPTDKQVVLSEANKWTHTWTDLDLHTKPGKPIKYSVREEQVAHYDAPVVNRLDASNIQLVNTHKPEEVTIKGAKTWQDEDNQHGIRPEFIIVTMQKNGIDYLSMKVTDKTNWAYDFGAQPKYEKGKEITYTVTEEDVTGYNAQVDGFNITNTLILGSVALVKTDAAGKPLANATFKLTKDGKQVGDHQTTDKSGRIQFDQLIIGTYQLEEVSAPTGYIRNTSPLTVNVTKDKLTQELSMMNYQGSAWVMKTDAANRPLKGAEFAVVSVANNTVKEITDKRLVTDRAGVASIEGLAPGKYAFVETKAPNGYQLNPEYKYFTIEAEQAGQVASVYAGDVINHLKPTTPSTTDTTSTSESTNSTTTDTTSTSESTSSTTTDTTSTSESTSSTTTDTTSTSESTSSTTTDTTSTSESTSSTTTDTESITVSPETTDSTSSTTTDTTSTSESTSSTTTDTESLIVTPGSTDKAPSSSSQSLTSSSMKDTNDKPKGKQLPKTGEQASSVLVIGLGILLVAIAYVVYRKRHVN